MTISKYERLVVRRPLRPAGSPDIKGLTPPMVYLSKEQVPEAEVFIELRWVYGVPEEAVQVAEQISDRDRILLFMGTDGAKPQVLGGTVGLRLGGQPILFNTTTSVFVPKGVPCDSVEWKDFQRPHLLMSMVLGDRDSYESPDRGSGNPDGVDYESFVIRSPMREAGPDRVDGRQNPTMTYMSGNQVVGVKHYIEVGWIWDVPSRRIPKMRHDNYEEIVLHVGTDPDAPEDLCGSMQFGMGDDLLEFDTNYCVFIPRSLDHGPLIWNEMRKPMLEIAMMLGAGTWAEGWEGSFFDEE